MDDGEAAWPLLAGGLEGHQPSAPADHFCGLLRPPGPDTAELQSLEPPIRRSFGGAQGPWDHWGRGLALVPSRAPMACTVHICTLSDHMDAFAKQPEASEATLAAWGHSGKVPGQRREDGRVSRLSTSQALVALHAGTWPPAACPKCCGNRRCPLPAPRLREQKVHTARVTKLPPSLSGRGCR